MNCEQIRTLMMDYLYDELEKKDQEEFISHLNRCDECREEVESLKTTSGILQQWGEVEDDIRIITVKEKPSFFERFKEFFHIRAFRPKKLAYGFACTFSAVFILLALANTEISVNNGNFNMRMGFFNHSEKPVESATSGSGELVEELLRQNFQLTSSLLEQSEERQRKEIAYVLSSLKKDIDQQRYQDLMTIQYEFKNIQKNTNQQISQIDRALGQLVRPAEIRY